MLNNKQISYEIYNILVEAKMIRVLFSHFFFNVGMKTAVYTEHTISNQIRLVDRLQIIFGLYSEFLTNYFNEALYQGIFRMPDKNQSK